MSEVAKFYKLHCVSPKLCIVEGFNPPVPQNVISFKDKAFKEVTKLKWGHRRGP